MKTSTKKSIFFCTACGYESNGYIGKCPACQVWDSFKAAPKISKPTKDAKHQLFVTPESELLKLSEIKEDEITRYDTKSPEFNRVLGDGLVPGSLTLVGGEPGIGKSTLLLQITKNFSEQNLNVLYVSAEESSRQLKLRANRLNINPHSNHISVFAENNLNQIIDIIETQEPNLVIVDSIQAVYIPDLDSVPGSPSQIRQCCGNLMRLAKSTNIPIIIVGHINKDGDIAGPKILEHMVDTVLQFENTRDSQIRFLRTIKNRFGSTDEVGIFRMESYGLIDLTNPSEIFLAERSDGMLFAVREGKRTLLLEMQALALNSDYNNPRRVANGIEISRLHQILAIVEKKLGVSLSKSDIYLNVVGGMAIKDTAADLSIALAVYNSIVGQSNDKDIVALGELGLSGEIRSVIDIEARVKECIKLGYKTIIIPEANHKKLKEDYKDAKIIAAKNISDLVKLR